MEKTYKSSRRQFLKATTALGVASFSSLPVSSNQFEIITKPIPSTGERIPVIGMGSWITFDIGHEPKLRDTQCRVLEKYFELGGTVLDSSPMYGYAEEVIGECLNHTGQDKIFSATKVWSPLKKLGAGQIEDSFELWGTDKFDLFQIHNLVGFEKHLETLQELKANNRIRYLGVTTSHGRRHRDLEKIILNAPIDFVQLTYNIQDREVENRLLPAAKERGIAVIVNRPFRRGQLFDRFQHQPLPVWVKDFDCANWAQFFLKFIVSHPAVTCAIPATSQVEHVVENMGAQRGRMPDGNMRKRMLDYIKGLS